MKMIKLRKIFKYNTPCISWISKIKSTLIYNTEDLHIVLAIYNLLEHSQNFSMTSGSWRNYYRDKIDNANDDTSDGHLKIVYKTTIV